MSYEALQNMVSSSKRIVFFGGAGVSTESGIPDFRSQDGLYHQKYDFPSLSGTRKSFSVSTGIKCCPWTQSPMPRI